MDHALSHGQRALANVDGQHKELDRHALPVEDRALGFEKVALTTATTQLPPRTTARMAIRADIAEPEPAAIPTVGIGTEMVRGVNVAPAATCRAKGRWRGPGGLPVR